MSLKVALEQLLGGKCYHMHELYQRPEHLALWHLVLDGETAVLNDILDGYCAALDWPFCAVWQEAVKMHPEALVLLSTRASASDWWSSVDQTVWQVMREKSFGFSDNPEEAASFARLHSRLAERFCTQWDDPVIARQAYDLHVDTVRSKVKEDRLLEFETGEGWGPLCQALGTAVPNGPFPDKNKRSHFMARNRG